MSTPPRFVIDQARQRHLAATAAVHYATLTYDGVEYAVTGRTDSEGFGLTGDASAMEINQLLTVFLAKSDLATRPVRGKHIVIDGRGFTIDSVGGDNSHDQHWSIRARRTPGQDD